MIDIHSHLLPLVDDGCDSSSRAIQLIKESCGEGVKTIILTPHFRGEFVKTPAQLECAFSEFKAQVENEQIPVQLFLGQEIFVTKDLKQELEKGELKSLADSKYLLLEFSYDNECEIAEIVYEITRIGYKPIIAHLERYSYVTVADAKEIKALGGLIQVNAKSLLVRDRTGIRKRARALVKNDLVDFVASDMHDGREFYLAKARRFISQKYGEDRAIKLFSDNAKEIIEG